MVLPKMLGKRHSVALGTCEGLSECQEAPKSPRLVRQLDWWLLWWFLSSCGARDGAIGAVLAAQGAGMRIRSG